MPAGGACRLATAVPRRVDRRDSEAAPGQVFGERQREESSLVLRETVPGEDKRGRISGLRKPEDSGDDFQLEVNLKFVLDQAQ